MFIYTVVVVAIVVIISSIVLLYSLLRNNILNIKLILTASLSSIAISLMFPMILNLVVNVFSFGMGIAIAFLITTILYAVFVFLITILISKFLLDKNIQMISDSLNNNRIGILLNKVAATLHNLTYKLKNNVLKQGRKRVGTDEVYLPEAELIADIIQEKNILEKPVDSEQNIDTMGIENISYFEINQEIDDTNALENNLEDISADNDTLINEDNILAAENVDENEFEVDIDYFTEDNINDQIVEPDEDNILIDIEKHDILIEHYEQESNESMTNDEMNILDATLNKQEQGVSVIEGKVDSIEIDYEKVQGLEVQVEYSTDSEANSVEINIDKDEVSKIEAAKEPDISEYIEKAFALKENGDSEGAVLNYMYALDKNKDRDLVFWIVLDICVLYKSMGQIELAKEILESYISNYGDLMDSSVRLEIERNLA
jgi:tetratricopeptide (TPR) repeat protein